jgi:hypothetical protein
MFKIWLHALLGYNGLLKLLTSAMRENTVIKTSVVRPTLTYLCYHGLYSKTITIGPLHFLLNLQHIQDCW